VHALRNIHRALVPDGILVDTQPVSAAPAVAAGKLHLGELDMRDWLATIRAVDELVAETVTAGLFDLKCEERFVVTDTFDDGPECMETVSGWQGTQVSAALARRARSATGPVTVRQEVRLRLFARSVVDVPTPG
jgi:hypothetical protein